MPAGMVVVAAAGFSCAPSQATSAEAARTQATRTKVEE
jgi:hypothetical protein